MSKTGTKLQNLGLHEYLSCMRIVMVNTTLPANIGSAARAMHTMGLSDLVVVKPKLPIDDSSHAHAAGGIAVLNNARTVADIQTALQDCQLVFAASSRSRHIPRPVVTPTQAAMIAQQFMDAHQQAINNSTTLVEAAHTTFQDTTNNVISDNIISDNVSSTNVASNDSSSDKDSSKNAANVAQIAILFGREDRGLTNEELACADYHIQIDANPNYPVLNVASAVQVIASFFYAHFCQTMTNDSQLTILDTSEPHTALASLSLDTINNSTDGSTLTSSPELQLALRQTWDEPAITHEQLSQLEVRLTTLMSNLQLLDPNHLRDFPSRLSRLTSRLQLDQKEYQLANAIIAKISQLLPKNESKNHHK